MTSNPPSRVAVFGTFYPIHQYAGCSTTGIVLALALGGPGRHITVYCQRGAKLPATAPRDRIELRPLWNHDDAPSLIRALARLVKDSRQYDLVLFNTYVTAFGRRPVSNVTGLLLPTLVAIGSRRPVTAYLHNFVETQDVQALGYRPGRVARAVARALEWGILLSCKSVMPLEQQARIVRDRFAEPVASLLLPYVEGVASVLSLDSAAVVSADRGLAAPRLVIFGSIGPQKDVAGLLRRLDGIAGRAGRHASVTLAGAVNPQFPGAREALDRVIPTLQWLSVDMAGPVSEDEVVPFLLRHDAVLLPYRATGGISGVLNLAALAGLDVIAYDLPQLREQATLLRAPVKFVAPDSDTELAVALSETDGLLGQRRVGDPRVLRQRLEETVTAVESLVRSVPRRDAAAGS
jgi:glycosyltransferase involved in cell wall biosynthesis